MQAVQQRQRLVQQVGTDLGRVVPCQQLSVGPVCMCNWCLRECRGSLCDAGVRVCNANSGGQSWRGRTGLHAQPSGRQKKKKKTQAASRSFRPIFSTHMLDSPNKSVPFPDRPNAWEAPSWSAPFNPVGWGQFRPWECKATSWAVTRWKAGGREKGGGNGGWRPRGLWASK